MSSVPETLGDAGALRHLAQAWRKACAVVLLLVSVFFLYAPSSGSLMGVWSESYGTTYTHGYIIAALVVWMVLRKRVQLASIAWSPSIGGSVLALAAGVAWLVSVRAGIEIFHQLLLVALLWLSIWAVFGVRMAMQLWVPIAFLIFAIPVWDYVNFILQEVTVKAVRLLLDLTTIPAYVDGNFVHLASGVFEIAGGCSGLHFFIVSLALGALSGEIGRDSMKVRIFLLALAGGIALLSNWLRVYIIIVAGYLTDMQHPLVREGHYNFGWMLFAVMMLVFFLLARRFAPAAGAESEHKAPATDGTPRVLPIAVAAVCVLAIPAWEFLRAAEPASLPSAYSLPAPKGWSLSEPGLAPEWHPVFIGADRIERAEYISPAGRRVQLFFAGYASQRQSKELVTYGNSLIGPGEGDVVSTTSAPDGIARDAIVQGPADRSVIRYYYDIGGRRTSRGVVAQLWYGLNALGREIPSSVVALRAVCTGDCEEARALLGEFAASANQETHR